MKNLPITRLMVGILVILAFTVVFTGCSRIGPKESPQEAEAGFDQNPLPVFPWHQFDVRENPEESVVRARLMLKDRPFYNAVVSYPGGTGYEEIIRCGVRFQENK